MPTAQKRSQSPLLALYVALACQSLYDGNLAVVESGKQRGELLITLLLRLADRYVRGNCHGRQESQRLEANPKFRLVHNQFGEHVAKLRCAADSPQRRANDAGKERRVAQFLPIAGHAFNDLANRTVTLLGAITAMVGAVANRTDRRTLERFSSPVELGQGFLVVASTAKLRLWWQ